MSAQAKSPESPPGESREDELRRLLESALDVPRDELRLFLEEAASSLELAREAEALLAGETALGDFLRPPAAPGDRPRVDRRRADRRRTDRGRSDVRRADLLHGFAAEPERIGPYTLRRVLGEGGMGRVYLAEQNEPVERQVAIKLVHGLLGEAAARRFRLERKALGRLSHPNIARLYEAGTTEEGRPFVVMELVDGPPITRYCDQQRQTIKERLRLFIAVCRGAQHAHQKQILHRDLKPSNILVAEVDGVAVPKIIDLGIAKSLGQPLTSASLTTGDSPIGTPRFMSPEALERSTKDDLDTRSDVYSLGVVLYELLAGVTPYSASGKDLQSLLREILEEPALPPSARLARLDVERRREAAAARRTRPERLVQELSGDLAWIVMKAMAKERELRYGSAAELAAELERVLDHQPVAARPPSTSYRLRKWVRRHRLPAAMIGITAAGLLSATLLTSLALARARQAEESSRHEAQVSRQSLDFLVGLFEAASPEQARGEPIDARQLLSAGVERLERGELEPVPRSQILHTLAEVYLRLGLYPEAIELATESLEIRQTELSEKSPEVLASLDLLAILERRSGNLERAEPLLERMVEIVEKQDDPGAQADALNSLGLLRWRQNRFEDAERLLVRSLELRRRHFGDAAREFAVSHNNLGALYQANALYVEAKRHLERAAFLLEKDLGQDHPNVAAALSNLAANQQRRGRFSEAAALQERLLDIHLRVFGPDHPQTATSYNNYSTLLADLGRFEEAEMNYRRAIDIRLRVLGPEHVEVIKAQRNLGLQLWRMGRFAEAEELLEQILYEERRRAGEDDASVARTRRNLALVWRDTGRVSEAREELLAVLDVQRRLFGDTHRDAASTLHHLGVLAGLQERFAEAEEWLRESLETRRQLANPEEKRLAETLFELGELARRRGRPGEAAARHAEALEVRQRILPEGHPDLLRSIAALR